MTDVVNSGYKTAAQAVAFSGTQTLVSLANDEWTDLSDAIDNSVGKYMFADWELVLGAAVWAGADAAVELYIVPSIDDTNYPDWTGNVATDQQENNQYFIGAVALKVTGGSISARANFRGVQLPAGKFKVAVRNRGNIAFAASGNTLYWCPWNYASQ